MRNFSSSALFRIVLLSGLLFTLVASPSHAVIGGSPDTVSQYSTVYLQSDKGSCTGSLISSTWILTAAHCLVGSSRMAVRAIDSRSGALLWESSGLRYFLNDYDDTNSRNDIGLLEIRQSVPGPYAVFASSAEIVATEEIGGTGIASGFGLTSQLGSVSSILLQISIQLLPSGICQKYWNYRVTYTSSFICSAPSLSATICSGDSGGPLFVAIGGERKIAGVTSFGSTTCGANISVFTRISPYLGWISEITSRSSNATTTSIVGISDSSTPSNNNVVVLPNLPPLVPGVVPPLYPTIGDSGRPVLPKFSVTRAFQLVITSSGKGCVIDLDADPSLRGRRISIYFTKNQKLPTFRKILDNFGDTIVTSSTPCSIIVRKGVWVTLDNSKLRLRAIL